MNNLCLHHIKDVYVKQKDYNDFRTFTLILRDKSNKHFQIELFTDLKTDLDFTSVVSDND